MRIELTHVGLLIYLANHYTTGGARVCVCMYVFASIYVHNVLYQFPCLKNLSDSGICILFYVFIILINLAYKNKLKHIEQSAGKNSQFF